MNTGQLTLSEATTRYELDPCANNHGGNAQSRAAWSDRSPEAHETQEKRILEVVSSRGQSGATRCEIRDQLRTSGFDIEYGTVTARVTSLLAFGKLRETGETRKTDKGRAAAVLVVTQ